MTLPTNENLQMPITNEQRLRIEQRLTDCERKPWIHLHDDHRYISIGFVRDDGVHVRGDTLLKLPEPYDSPQSDHNVAVRWVQAVADLLAHETKADG